jgi:hypothetical protein
MARKILNRKELREEHDTAERIAEDDELEEREEAVEEEEEEEESVKSVKPVKKPSRRKPRAKAGKEVRLKAFWGVFSQSLNQVAQFEYSQRAEAAKKAEELSESRKSPHFVQLVKKVIEE